MSFAVETAVLEGEPKIDVTEPEVLITQSDQEETHLTAEVDSLWLAHNEANALRKHTAAELRAIKLKLGERLHAVKQLLSKPGRGGKYHRWLRERHIPRSSSDRLINRHLESIGLVAPTEATSPEEEIEKLLTFLAEKLKRALPDEVERYQAANRLLNKLGLQVEESDESFIVLEPEIEPDEPCDDELGDDLFRTSGSSSDGALAMDQEEPATDGANDPPAIVPEERRRQIEL